MKTISRWLACLAMLGMLLVSVSPIAYAQPVMPHFFYGTVKINGSDAPIGTVVKAKVSGVECGSYTTTEVGKYGSLDKSDYLLVQGDITEGATINFYVNGVDSGETASFVPGGGPTQKNLSVTITEEVGGPGVGAPAYYTSTSVFGTSGRFQTDSSGKLLEAFEATSADGKLTVTIPKDTIAKDKNGNRLTSLTAGVDPSPPDPLEDSQIIGLAYNFGPDGASFNPAITFTWKYDPDALPEGVAEEDLIIAYYDEVNDEWVELDCVVDTENDTITASVSHFTTFAIIGAVVTPPPPAPAIFSVSSLSVKPLEVEPNEAVTISLSVANTGGTEGSYTVVLKINGVKEAEKSLTIAAGSSEIVTFSVTREETGSYNVAVNGLSGSFTIVAPTPPPEEEEIAPPEEEEVVPPALVSPFNWPLIGGIIAAVVVVGLLIFFLVRRRGA